MKLRVLKKETYLAAIKGSVGARMFRHVFASINDKKRDILKNGELSCAFFVSSVLRMFGLIKNQHATVKGAVADLKRTGWKQVKIPKPGDVLVWETLFYEDGPHAHIGFYMGNKSAISNSASKRAPEKHHWNYRNKRKIEAIFRHPKPR